MWLRLWILGQFLAPSMTTDRDVCTCHHSTPGDGLGTPHGKGGGGTRALTEVLHHHPPQVLLSPRGQWAQIQVGGCARPPERLRAKDPFVARVWPFVCGVRRGPGVVGVCGASVRGSGGVEWRVWCVLAQLEGLRGRLGVGGAWDWVNVSMKPPLVSTLSGGQRTPRKGQSSVLSLGYPLEYLAAR